MKRDMVYAGSVKEITALAEVIMAGRAAETQGRATYLRSLLAGVQTEVLGKPVLRALRGSHKAIEADTAVTALEKVNLAYYDAVLAAVPDNLDAQERNSRTNFARTSASALRRALKLGWSILTPLGEVTKAALNEWSSEHATPAPLTLARAQTRVSGYLERIQEMLDQLPPNEAQAIARALVADLSPVSGTPAQKVTAVSLRKHDRPPLQAPH